MAVGADHVGFRADADVLVALGANRLDPDRIANAVVVLDHRPRPRQGMIHGGDFVVQDVRISRVEIDALLDHGLSFSRLSSRHDVGRSNSILAAIDTSSRAAPALSWPASGSRPH